MKYILVVSFLFIGVVESIRHNKLTVSGAITGGIIGLLLFVASGWTGLLLLTTFFSFGTLATSWGHKQKREAGLAQEAKGRRSAGQVIANGGVAGVLSLFSFLLPHQGSLFMLMIAGAFSSALADTLSSELGTLYGRRFYNVLTFQRDEKGKDGVVSAEGTFIGLVGSCLIAVIYSAGFGWSVHFFWVVLAGTLGNLADSLLGAGLERQHRMDNNTVNLLNTLTGAMVAFMLWSL